MSSVNLSPVEFFLLAGSVGKAVMLILLAASIWCWVLIIEGIVGIFRFKAALRHWRRDETSSLLASVIDAGHKASGLLIPGEGVGDTRMRIIEAMNRNARSVIAAVEGGLPNLAVISSVAPFVGLFGTVWGIMSSFIAIGAAKDTSLAVVAPGIAEALAATAIGLAAAIPASVGYTRIGAAIGGATQDLAGLIEEEALRAVTPNVRHHGLKEVV
jgi:biopolymer transport protein ExbB/TolQ